jgi:CDP-6-deoxy-D-xylo-4-hexulose-3-dehydrase
MSNLEEKKQKILDLVSEYINEKNNKTWNKETDWVSYSGPVFDDKEYVAAIKTLLNGWLIVGENTKEFEKKFPKLLGKRHGILSNSGSSANLLMVAAAKSKRLYNLPDGTKFITPVVCFPTTINPLIQNNLKPVFVDVELPNLNLNLDEVEKTLEKDPTIRGIIFAHVLGNPPDMDRLMSIVKKHNLIFLEDACDALGSFYGGKRLGSFGDLSTCSFFPAHHMTMGEGGFVATDDSKAKMALASFRDWGRACYCNVSMPGCVVDKTACGNRFKNWLPGMPDATYDHRYVFDEIGYNLKPLDLQAAIGLEQIEKLPMLESARRENFNKLTKIFSKHEKYFHLPVATEKSDPCWFGFLVTVKDGSPFTKQDIVNFLESKKIQTRSYFSGNILFHPGYQELAKEYNDLNSLFPIANKVTRDTFFLGTFAGLTDEKIDYISSVVEEFFVKIQDSFKLKVL